MPSIVVANNHNDGTDRAWREADGRRSSEANKNMINLYIGDCFVKKSDSKYSS